MRVVWDDSKNDANRRKHDVSFEEASALFAGTNKHLEIFDEVHSEEEDRFIAIGPIGRGLVIVAYTSPDDETVRIVSARWATKREAELYRAYIGGGGS